MKFVALVTAAALATTSAYGHELVEPVMEPEMIIEEASSSSSADLMIPLLALLLVAAAASSSGSAPVGAPSDIRVKTDILKTGVSPSGLSIYQFRYIGLSTLYEGVMAQDVLSHTPGAVIVGPGGLLMVDYSKIDAEMRIIH